MEKSTTHWIAQVRTLPRKMVATVVVLTKKGYTQLKSRYGPRYTKVMVAAVFLALFVPVPGILPLALALVVAVAEVHHVISKVGRIRTSSSKESTLPLHRDMVLNWNRYTGGANRRATSRPALMQVHCGRDRDPRFSDYGEPGTSN